MHGALGAKVPGLRRNVQNHAIPEAAYTFADKVGRKYGADLRTMNRPGEHRVVVTLRPVMVNATNLGD